MKWSHLMIHHSAGPDDGAAFDIDRYRHHHVKKNGWRDLGYHFVVERVGGAYRAIAGRPLYVAGAHCPGMNNKAVGICLAGDFTAAPPPDGQLEEAARLAAGLCAALDIPVTSIVRHRDHRATECPGDAFDLQGFRGRVLELLEAG